MGVLVQMQGQVDPQGLVDPQLKPCLDRIWISSQRLKQLYDIQIRLRREIHREESIRRREKRALKEMRKEIEQFGRVLPVSRIG